MADDERPWKVRSFIAVNNYHVIVEQSRAEQSYYDTTLLAHLVYESTRAVYAEYEGLEYEIDSSIPLCCQLLEYSETLQITGRTDPDGLQFLISPSRHIHRIDRFNIPYDLLGDTPILPYTRNMTVSFYWRIIIPTVTIYNIIEGKELISFPVILLSGFGFVMDVSHIVRRCCDYGKFLGSLVPVFDESECQPWVFQKGLLVDGRSFHRSTLRFFIAPATLQLADLRCLCAIHAVP
jgi:hypothetical protein